MTNYSLILGLVVSCDKMGYQLNMSQIIWANTCKDISAFMAFRFQINK